MYSLLETVCKHFFKQYAAPHYWVAYSGGMDSHVLLTLAAAWRHLEGFQLSAVHVNHHLQAQATQWEQHCRMVCEQLAIPFIVQHVTEERMPGESIEAWARHQRDVIFSQLLQLNDCLLTAHHQNDQAETVLLQLLRGAGIKGLSAMPIHKPLGLGYHARPLLSVKQSILRDYALHHALQWIEDPSNQATQLARNFIRHAILPQLSQRFPAVLTTITRTAQHCSEAQQWLEQCTKPILRDVMGDKPHTLSVERLLAQDEATQRLLLRTFIVTCGYLLPGTKKLEALRKQLLWARPDRMPQVEWGGAVMRRYRGLLYLTRSLATIDREQSWRWEIEQPLQLTGVGWLSVSWAKGQGLSGALQCVTVRFRSGGEKLHLRGNQHHTLKKLLQAWHIPVWERDRLPLLFDKERCIGVVGYAFDQHSQAKTDEMGWIPHLETTYLD